MMTVLSLLSQSSFSRSSDRLKVSRLMSRSLWIGSLTAMGLLCGWVPNVQYPTSALSRVSESGVSESGVSESGVPDSSSFNLSFDSAAYAQAAVTDSEIQSYARSVLQIEPIRQSAYDNIKRASGAEVPPILCHRPSSLNNLDPSIRSIAIDYCNQAIAIVENNSLSITRFNEITMAHKSDSGLAGRIQQAMAVIQGQ